MRRALSSKLPLSLYHHNHHKNVSRQAAHCSVYYTLVDRKDEWWDGCPRGRVLIVHRSFVQKAEEKVEKVTGKN
jgi:hypothetical protein